MSKSNKYGYSGVNIPTQAFQSNKGKFDPSEINELVANDQWTQYGQLELIETKTVTSSSLITFNNIKSDIYNVHFMTLNNMKTDKSSGNVQLGIRFAESGTLETGNNYQFAIDRFQGGSFSDQYTNSFSRIALGWYSIDNGTYNCENAHVYFYNLGDGTKYSFTTSQSTGYNYEDQQAMGYGSGVLPQASFVDQIQISDYNTLDNLSGVISLYGIKEYS
jgi:hypothetical protein